MPRKQLAHAVRANPNDTAPQHKPQPWTDRDEEAMNYFLYSKLCDPCANYAEPVWIRPSAIVEAKQPVVGYTWRGVE